ncbi:hypothetical protein JK628_19250 [Shewanella sp. KX20019]|uniref:hypothetical protein n=1 Tax=Shewanella sp. KX20019 TaxID=2803864 RepID=UPI00192699D5|nr:hypothetical protein [Shewanella sp. KX20019]QQX79629.1 hypothetical protein JK628_19250 [Shewanella sp. KX20019]
MLKLMLGAALTIGLMGCSASAENDTKAMPALLLSPDRYSTRQLAQAISELLKVNEVTLSQTAFTQTSLLAVERAPHKDPSGQLIMGRSHEMPQMVQLFMQGDVCILRLQNSDEERALPRLKCKAE